MKKSSTSPDTPERPTPSARRGATHPAKRETVEEAVARVRAIPGFLEEIGPEAIAQFQREAAKYPEVMGYLPPLKGNKGR
jgi:hypothetical protein